MRQADVVIVGAGLAGLTAARDLARNGMDTVVLEATDQIGGRARSVRLDAEHVADVGGEWLGPGHRALGRLVRDYGLTVTPAGNLGHPVRWLLPGGEAIGRLPPRSTWSDLRRIGAAATRESRGVRPIAPWLAPGAAEHDRVSVGDWLDGLAVGADARHIVERTVEALSLAPTADMSLLHLLWWMRMAGGPLRTLHTTFHARLRDGAQELARRMAVDCGEVRLAHPVDAVDQDGGGIEVRCGAEVLQAQAAVVAVPPVTLGAIAFDPPLERASAESELAMGGGTKVTGLLPVASEPRWTTVVGGPTLSAAWRVGRRVSGFGDQSADGLEDSVLVEALGESFGVDAAAIAPVAIQRWSRTTFTPGCEIAFRPGQVCAVAPRLASTHGRVHFAGAERSEWPNSMEGAVRSGRRAAHAILSGRV